MDQDLYNYHSGTADVSFLLNNSEVIHDAMFVPVTKHLFAYTFDNSTYLVQNPNLTNIERENADVDLELIDEIIPVIPLRTIQIKARISKVNYGKIYRPLYDTDEDYLID